MNELFFETDYLTLWAAVGAIAQGVASLLAIAALLYSMITFRKSLKLSNYAEMDRMYFDLLNLRLEKAHLQGQQATNASDQNRREYENYAFMVWNFLETIHDRCERDKALCDTWFPILKHEGLLHKEWFERPDSALKFKPQFVEFAQSKFKEWQNESSKPGGATAEGPTAPGVAT